MNIAIVASNHLSLQKDTKKGTEIIVHDFINNFEKFKTKNISLTAFASGDSDLSVKIESIMQDSSSRNEAVLKDNKQIIFELALLSKAFSMQEQFDLFHINIGDGDIALPFLPFLKKPLLITLYHPTNSGYANDYFSIFKENKNIFFVSPTNWQRKKVNLPYLTTIYHGVDTENTFIFDATGGDTMMWAGRAIPNKGVDIAVSVSQRCNQKLNLFAVTKAEHEKWFNHFLNEKRLDSDISINLNKDRLDLIKHYQKSKLFILPIQWEEPFGLVMAESLACGTPVIAFARGSVPEVIEDGKTGFIINPSNNDIRGNWIIKKTGVDGLEEAVRKIYSLSSRNYLEMRKNCRQSAEQNFSLKKMINEYEKVYASIVTKSKKQLRFKEN